MILKSFFVDIEKGKNMHIFVLQPNIGTIRSQIVKAQTAT